MKEALRLEHDLTLFSIDTLDKYVEIMFRFTGSISKEFAEEYFRLAEEIRRKRLERVKKELTEFARRYITIHDGEYIDPNTLMICIDHDGKRMCRRIEDKTAMKKIKIKAEKLKDKHRARLGFAIDDINSIIKKRFEEKIPKILEETINLDEVAKQIE